MLVLLPSAYSLLLNVAYLGPHHALRAGTETVDLCVAFFAMWAPWLLTYRQSWVASQSWWCGCCCRAPQGGGSNGGGSGGSRGCGSANRCSRQLPAAWVAALFAVLVVVVAPLRTAQCLTGVCDTFSMTYYEILTATPVASAISSSYVGIAIFWQVVVPALASLCLLRRQRRRGPASPSGSAGAPAAASPTAGSEQGAGDAPEQGASVSAGGGGGGDGVGDGALLLRSRAATGPRCECAPCSSRPGRRCCRIRPFMTLGVTMFFVVTFVATSLVYGGGLAEYGVKGQWIFALALPAASPFVLTALWLDSRGSLPWRSSVPYLLGVVLTWQGLYTIRDAWSSAIQLGLGAGGGPGSALQLAWLYAFFGLVTLWTMMNELLAIGGTPTRYAALPCILPMLVGGDLFTSLVIIDVEALSLTFFALLLMEALLKVAVATRLAMDAVASLRARRLQWHVPGVASPQGGAAHDTSTPASRGKLEEYLTVSHWRLHYTVISALASVGIAAAVLLMVVVEWAAAPWLATLAGFPGVAAQMRDANATAASVTWFQPGCLEYGRDSSSGGSSSSMAGCNWQQGLLLAGVAPSARGGLVVSYCVLLVAAACTSAFTVWYLSRRIAYLRRTLTCLPRHAPSARRQTGGGGASEGVELASTAAGAAVALHSRSSARARKTAANGGVFATANPMMRARDREAPASVSAGAAQSDDRTAADVEVGPGPGAGGGGALAVAAAAAPPGTNGPACGGGGGRASVLVMQRQWRPAESVWRFWARHGAVCAMACLWVVLNVMEQVFVSRLQLLQAEAETQMGGEGVRNI